MIYAHKNPFSLQTSFTDNNTDAKQLKFFYGEYTFILSYDQSAFKNARDQSQIAFYGFYNPFSS